MSLPSCYLDYGRRVAWICHCRHAYAPMSNTASHDNHEKINLWFSFCLPHGYGASLSKWSQLQPLLYSKARSPRMQVKCTFQEIRICNRFIQLMGWHPCMTCNSNHVVIHLGDYNCSVHIKYPFNKWQIAQTNHHMIWVSWQRGCQHILRIQIINTCHGVDEDPPSESI